MQNIEEVKDIRNIERRTTVHYIELELDFGQSARYIILTEDLNKHHVCARWVPNLITDEQKALGDEVCKDWQGKVGRHRRYFLSNTMTIDETCIYSFEEVKIY